MNTLRYGHLLFEPLSEVDFALVHEWLNAPHVAEWWDGPVTFEDVRDKFRGVISSEWQQGFIVSTAGQRIGYIQSYRAHRIGEGWWPDEPASTLGIDQFLGDSALLGQGLGTEMVRLYSDHLLRCCMPAERIIADPKPDNIRAIRSYIKAGFREVELVETPDGMAMLMEKRLQVPNSL
jgi:RimJ/RimL family protein N-acetyltransferase